MVIFYSYNISPYAAKVRAILSWKKIPFEERLVHPARRGELVSLTGRNQVPVIVDGDRAVTDSTAIARFLDEKYAERPIIPRDPALRARALLLEEWGDEGLPRVVQPVRWLMKNNFAKTAARWRSSYPTGPVDDALLAIAARVALARQRKKYTLTVPTDYLNRLGEVLRYLDDALAESGFLVGNAPTVADFAAYGFLSQLDGLDGWETVKSHRRVWKWLRNLAPATSSEGMAETEEAQRDADVHRGR